MADGPQPATADFNVVLSVTLPEGYTGDSKVVTRKNIDASGNIVDFGDGKTYENGDIIPIKAGEWALFGFADIADCAGVWYHGSQMDGGRVAVVDTPTDGSDATLRLGYNNTAGLRLGFMGTANIEPGANFGAGGNNLADGSGGSHPVGVYVDGVATSNFTVTSSDESVCTVAQDGTYIRVTNMGYGISVLTVTAGGYTEQFNWCNNPEPGADEGEGGGEGPAAGPYTVNFQVNYPGEYEGEPVGGIRVYDFDVVPGPGADLSGLETAEYTDYTSLEEPIEMAAGEVFWYSVIPLEGYESISDYNDGDAFNNCTNGEYRAFIANGGAEMLIMVTYGHNLGGEGEGPMGPVVSEDDYEIVLELGYEGFAEDELVGGGIVVFDGDGNYVGTYTESTTIPVSGGTKFLFRPIHAYGSDHSFEGVSGTENGFYACYDDSTLRMVYTSCGTGGTESNNAPRSDYTVDFTLAYDGFEPGMCFGGGIVVFDENGDYVATYTGTSGTQSITVPGGTALLFQEIPILGAYGSLNGKQGELGRCGVRWEAGEMTLAYTFGGDGGDGGEGPMGPQPAVMDFDVAIRVELPEGYEGDGKVVTRKARENGDGPLVDFGDGAVYGDGDTVSVKAGEWAIFGAEAMDGYAVQYIFNNAGGCGTMGEGPESSVRYAVIESVDYGDAPVELVVRYVSTAGITLNWYDSILRPDTGFGVGGLDVTETLRVLYDGEQVSDFTVTNENDDVCTVEKDGANVLITSVGYGNSNIPVTVNGETATFTWCCDPGPSGDTVTVTVDYPEDFDIPHVGGVEVYDENGVYQYSCGGGEITVGEGGRLIVKVIEIEGAVVDSSWHYCGDMEINGEIYRVIDAGGSVELYYHDASQVGDPEIAIAHPGAEGVIPGGADIGWEPGTYEMEVRLDGEMTGEFNAYSSDESVCAVRNENGLLVIESRNPGWCTITIEHSRHNGIEVAYNWIYEESIYQGISLAPEEALDGAIPAGARFGMPVWGEYRYKVRLDTFFVGDFTVTSDNTDLCEVSNKDGWLVVNSKGFGETPIHITVDGTTVDFTWVCMEPAMSVKPPEAGAPKTDAALNGGSTVVSDITEDGNGSVLVISSTIGNETSNIVVHTDNMEAIEEALEDENVSVGVVFGSMDINPEDISEPDLDAADEYAAGLIDEEKGERITALTLVDIFAELATVYPDRPGERLGAITEMDEEIEFTMAVKKDALREVGRDIRHLTVIHVHNGEAYTAWEYSEDYYYEETEDSYILHFEVNRFSPFILAYDWVIGDIDGDDKPADPTDLIRMMKYIAGEDVTVVADSVDVNGDGRGDILDVIRLMRAISGEDVELS